MNRTLALRSARSRLFRVRLGPFRESISASETLRVLPIALPVMAVGAAGIAGAAAALISERPSSDAMAGTLGLLAAATLAEALPLPIEGVRAGATSLATVFIVATGVLYGWEHAAFVAFVTMAFVEILRRKPLLRLLYNTSLYVSAAVAAGLVAAGSRGTGLVQLVAAAVSAALAFYVVDIVLLAAVVARARARSFLDSLRAYLFSTALPFGIMASLTVTLVVLWERSPYLTVLLAGPLLAVAIYQRWLHGALEQLREFDRLKDELIAVISHELRTPLTSVYGAALTLRQQNVSPEMRESLLSIVSSEAGRLARLLDDVLWASRLDTGRAETTIVPTDAGELAAEVVDAAQQRLPEGITLDLLQGPSLPPVAADPDKLRQVLVNLVENAIKYSPDGGRVRVTLEQMGSWLRLSVQDEGIGIPAGEEERIFEKFHRLDPRMTRGVGGSGLGLYICRALIEGMDGRIWVRSREGRGSAFVFELPLARADS